MYKVKALDGASRIGEWAVCGKSSSTKTNWRILQWSRGRSWPFSSSVLESGVWGCSVSRPSWYNQRGAKWALLNLVLSLLSLYVRTYCVWESLGWVLLGIAEDLVVEGFILFLSPTSWENLGEASRYSVSVYLRCLCHRILTRHEIWFLWEMLRCSPKRNAYLRWCKWKS